MKTDYWSQRFTNVDPLGIIAITDLMNAGVYEFADQTYYYSDMMKWMVCLNVYFLLFNPYTGVTL